MKKLFLVIIIGILCLPMFSTFTTVHASLPAPPPAVPPPLPARYDEQLWLDFNGSYFSTAYTYNVSAVAQNDSDGYGPAYFLNGLTDIGYWYQVAVAYNYAGYAAGYIGGFRFAYEVWNDTGYSVFPSEAGPGSDSFSGPVNDGDKILLSLDIYDGNKGIPGLPPPSWQVNMSAYDWNTGAGAYKTFSGNPQPPPEGYMMPSFMGTATNPNAYGFFTGLMTEWYHVNAYFGGESEVVYSTSTALSSGALMADEIDSSTETTMLQFYGGVFTFSPPNQLMYYDPGYNIQEAASGYLFVTGSRLYTTLQIGTPQFIDPSSGNTYVNSSTQFTLTTHYGGGTITTKVEIFNSTLTTGWITVAGPFTFHASDGTYTIGYYSYDSLGMVENVHAVNVTLDNTPPTTKLTVGNPQYTDPSGNLYVASWTTFTLSATDGGSGVAKTSYRIRNGTYGSGWLAYAAPFTLTGLATGAYSVDYNSTDNLGNVEAMHTKNVILNSKATMIGYSKNEIQALIALVNGSPIGMMLKNYLVLNVLGPASNQNDLAFMLVLNGKSATANNALMVGRKMMQGFMSWVMNARAFGMIPAGTAAIWLAAAQTIINDINTAIATP